MINLALVESALANYAVSGRQVQFTSPISISDLYSLFPHEPGAEVAVHKWPDDYPGAGKPGVYLIFCADRTLLYVGSSARDVQNRLAFYFRGGRRPCYLNEKVTPPWKTRPCFVHTITVHDPDEAPILERFLINALNPPENTRRW